jgi:hypothetical protein
MTREEHLKWAKERAGECSARGEYLGAWLSFRSDMAKHEELKNHIALELGDHHAAALMYNPNSLSTGIRLKDFIEGFN